MCDLKFLNFQNTEMILLTSLGCKICHCLTDEECESGFVRSVKISVSFYSKMRFEFSN